MEVIRSSSTAASLSASLTTAESSSTAASLPLVDLPTGRCNLRWLGAELILEIFRKIFFKIFMKIFQNFLKIFKISLENLSLTLDKFRKIMI